jgi:hypothetical protein
VNDMAYIDVSWATGLINEWMNGWTLYVGYARGIIVSVMYWFGKGTKAGCLLNKPCSYKRCVLPIPGEKLTHNSYFRKCFWSNLPFAWHSNLCWC